MKEEEKQRKFHSALLQKLYPPRQQEEDQEGKRNSIDTLNCPPDAVEEVENEEGRSCSSPSRGGENGGDEKLTRAQRKRRRQKKMKEAAATRPRKIIGPLLPDSGHDCGNVSEGVRGNATAGGDAHPAPATQTSEEIFSISTKPNKVKQRRKMKKLGGERIGTLGIEVCASDPFNVHE